MVGQKKKRQINLLPREGFEETTTGRVLTWIITTFRIIVIFTELIVVSAFVARFFLDASNSDLTDELERKLNIVKSNYGFEREFKNTQTRISSYENLNNNNFSYSEVLKNLTQYLPGEVFLESIAVSQDEVSLSGRSLSERGIQQFLVNLKAQEIFKEINLGQVGYKEGDLFLTFNVDVSLAEN